MKADSFKLPSCSRLAISKLLLSFALVTLLILPTAVSLAARPKVGANLSLAQPAPAGTLIEVNTTGDGDNLNPGAGCDADASAPGEQCSLRAAIERANALGGEVEIRFNIPSTQPNCDSASGSCAINLTKALPEVSANLSITGPGSNKLTVQRSTGGNYRIFAFAQGVVSASISGLTISKGYTYGAGGGVMFSGKTLNVRGCLFSENTSEDAGGGIAATGTLNVTDSTFSGNVAVVGGSGRGGGGIFSDGTLNVTGGTFRDNKSRFFGGGIFSSTASTADARIADSTFERNRAESGGALAVFGSAVQVTKSIFSLNTTTAGSGGIYQTGGTLTVTDSTIHDNEGFGLVTVRGIIGGAPATATVVNSTISSNGRGGITTGIAPTAESKLTVVGSTISDNKEGPGITIANRATLNITNSTIARNLEGGVVRIETATDPGTWSVKSSLIASNRLDDVRGDFTSGGFNLIGKTDNSTGFTQPTDRTGTATSPLDPRLDSNGLRDNGGTTKTISLDPGSPAIDHGTADGLNGQLTTDQRGTGFTRTYDHPTVANSAGGDGTDIGAFERNAADPIPPTVLQLSAATYSVNENGGAATITVTRTGDNANPVSVRYRSSAITATGGTIDYADVSGTLDWAAGDNSVKTFTVPVTSDASDEDNETITLTLSDPQGGAKLGGQSQAVLTIVDDDPLPLLSLGFASVNEGNSGVTNMVVPITLNEASGKVVTVRVSTIDGGTATAGTDYTPINNVLVTFAPGQKQASVTLQVMGDTTVEPDETILVRISNANNGQVAGFQTSVRIRNDDVDQPTSELKFGAAAYDVNEGGGTATIEVTRTGSTTGTVTVRYTMTGETATINSDYTNTFGELTFESGQTTRSFSVPIINDSSKETDETATLTLSSPTGGASLGTPSMALLTIVDDDPQPNVSIGDITVTEGDAGTGEARFTINLSAPTYQAVTVSYATSDGTAQAGVDYESASGFVTFNPGETSKTVSVAVRADRLTETDENFFVNLSGQQNGSLGDGQGAATILNDDTTFLQFGGNAYATQEGAGHLDVIVTKTGDASFPITVDYQTSDQSALIPCQTNNTGFASDRCDYATASGTITFAPGETQKVIPLVLVNDAYVEGPEALSITLSNPQGAALGSVDTSTVTISDEDSQVATENPIDDTDFFIRQLYIDFLGREPEPAGLQFWNNRMVNCPVGETCDRVDTAIRFFSSDEFKERGYFVYLFYHAALGRRPTYSEWITDVSRLNGFKSVAEQEAAKEAFINEFMLRQEFMGVYNQHQTGQTFVDALVQKSEVATNSRQQLINNYDTLGRAKTLRAFLETPETQAAFMNRAFVSMLYFGFLRRSPEAGGFDFWMQKLSQAGGGYRFPVGGFMQSDEFRFRFAELPLNR